MTDVRSLICTHLAELLREEGVEPPDLSDSLILLESGLDSLGFAVLVTRLTDSLGYDPFTISDEAIYPRSLGEFIEMYERFGPRSQ